MPIITTNIKFTSTKPIQIQQEYGFKLINPPFETHCEHYFWKEKSERDSNAARMINLKFEVELLERFTVMTYPENTQQEEEIHNV